MGKKSCQHPKHAERKDPRTGRVTCGDCRATLRYEPAENKAIIQSVPPVSRKQVQ